MQQKILSRLQAADALRADTRSFRKYLLALRKMCSVRGILPSSHVLSQGLARLGHAPVARGGFADVWEGTYKDKRTAIKILRTYDDIDCKRMIKVCIICLNFSSRLNYHLQVLLQGSRDLETIVSSKYRPLFWRLGHVLSLVSGI
jgi:hypothetical protein